MLTLFIKPECPYCQKVLKYLDTTNLDYTTLDVHKEPNHRELMQLGEQDQVPFLYDKDKNVKMYESNDIIEYLKTLA